MSMDELEELAPRPYKDLKFFEKRLASMYFVRSTEMLESGTPMRWGKTRLECAQAACLQAIRITVIPFGLVGAAGLVLVSAKSGMLTLGLGIAFLTVFAGGLIRGVVVAQRQVRYFRARREQENRIPPRRA